MRKLLSPLTLLLAAAVAPAAATGETADACLASIAATEAAEPGLPEGLLGAVAMTESARRVPGENRAVPWPWTINSPAGAFYLPDRAAAVAKVKELRAAGHGNIDVGCMQINLHHHPDAFASLQEAFDPDANVAYAARFLGALEAETPALFEAVGFYHSRTPWRSRDYARKVYRHWGRPLPPAAREPAERRGAVIYRADADAPRGWTREVIAAEDRPQAGTTERRVLRRSGFDDWMAGRPP